MNKLTRCEKFLGGEIDVPSESLILRPSAYGIVLRDNKLITLLNKDTGKLSLPGGRLETWESPEQALRREIREEAGISIEIQAKAFYSHHFFHYDPTGESFNCFLLYYVCTSLETNLTDQWNEKGDASSGPHWSSVAELSPNQFQVDGELICSFLEACDL